MFRAYSLPSSHEHPSLAPPPSSVSSPSVQMPNVFVHPPEDEAMPWCAFDANQESVSSEMAFTTPEMGHLQSKLDDWSHTVHPTADHAPVFHRSQAGSAIVMPRRGSSQSSLLRNPNPLGLASIPESPKRAKESDDDDIVEVMKVRRGEGMPDVGYAHGSVRTLGRSKTLRSRAAHALRSIKNVGKAPRRPTLDQVFPAKENGNAAKIMAPAPTQVPPTADKRRPKALPTSNQSSMPRLKKRVSQPLSNLFGLGASEAAANSSDTIGAGVSSSHSGGFRTLPYSRSASASTPTLQLLSAEPTRPTSPSFSIRGTRHKFSFVNLQTIFSGNTTSASDLASEPQQESTNIEVEEPAPPHKMQTPVDDGWDSGEDYDSPRRHADPWTMPRHRDESSHPSQGTSFDMRLNSLHFDSFSFDADAFEI
ncbi:hypothetical protein F5148DRAFT_840577 [Russula earlei]|uniref:Uncharacterized protein n=1 Tax=Russula earlei TaxID=71964 RepID=A0ACC0UCM2_9AGAM|nr:hypothetical protein F5148DRAFT_840577 [Russula earlei]